jgi:Sec-independent protein translocase protein TatA
MSISLGQILMIILVGLLLFGNFPNIMRYIIRSIKSILSSISENTEKPTKVEQNKIQEKGDSNP